MIKRVVATFLLLGGAAQADPRDEALSAMVRCSALADRNARLGCYDATMTRAPGALNQAAPLRPTAMIAAPPPVTPHRERTSGFMAGLFGSGPKRAVQTSSAQFGSESIADGGGHATPIPMDGDTIDEISARVIAYSFDGGFVTVTLDNGQVWRQTPGASPVGHLSGPAGSYTAVIERGSVGGSYSMHLSGRAGVIAVRRTR